MNNLHKTFPGSYQKSSKDYQYYLVGDLFQAQQLDYTTVSQQLEQASLALGKFSAQIEKIPNPNGFIRAFSTSEANQSSRIEGTQTSIEDVYKKIEDVSLETRDDWQEIQNYITALNQGIAQLGDMPLCNRLIKDIHAILLNNSRGKHKLPGQFRTSQNWIGGSRPDNAHFVPPSAEYVLDAMTNLEAFMHDTNNTMPQLIKAGLIHYQFETIHPFLDGNGRIGRMLISLYLLEKKILNQPILYISNFFERRREDYYLMLDNARESQQGVIKWLSFFLHGVHHTATQGIEQTEKLIQLRETLNSRVLSLGRRAKHAQKLLDFLFYQPFVKTKEISQELKVSAQITQTLVAEFVELQILLEVTGYKRNRIFAFIDYLKLLHFDND